MLVAPSEILISESQISVLEGNGFALREKQTNIFLKKIPQQPIHV